MLGAVLEGSARCVRATGEGGDGDASRNNLGATRRSASSIPLFRRDLVAIVMDGSHFLGIATRLDLVNYFRIAQTS